MEIDNSEFIKAVEKLIAEGKLPKPNDYKEPPAKESRSDQYAEQREEIRLTVDKNCRICSETGWATWDEYTVPFEQVIIGPGSKNQIVERSGLCSCVRPSVSLSGLLT